MQDTRASYVHGWSVLTGRPKSEIYVPRALQPDLCYKCGWIRDSRVNGSGPHRGCSQGKW